MLRPKLPDIPTPPTTTVTPQHTQAPASSVGHPVAPYVGVGVGAVAVVVVGIVLTALLAALAVSAVSVAIAAVVLRSLLSSANKR
ncbi:SpdD protein [Streptomyces sp. NPDC001231]|uniref:SpdD protein n=1 Tax=Streptomyces sp. NPDC001231 TaxID=3364549 RepID=UPI0036C47009